MRSATAYRPCWKFACTLTTELRSYGGLQIGHSVVGGRCSVPVDTVSSFVSCLVYKSLVLERYRLSSLSLTESLRAKFQQSCHRSVSPFSNLHSRVAA
jgi:hypothetical protein